MELGCARHRLPKLAFSAQSGEFCTQNTTGAVATPDNYVLQPGLGSPYGNTEMIVNNASVKRVDESSLEVLVVQLLGGGGGAQGGKPTSPASAVVAMANAGIVAATRFVGWFMCG